MRRDAIEAGVAMSRALDDEQWQWTEPSTRISLLQLSSTSFQYEQTQHWLGPSPYSFFFPTYYVQYASIGPMSKPLTTKNPWGSDHFFFKWQVLRLKSNNNKKLVEKSIISEIKWNWKNDEAGKRYQHAIPGHSWPIDPIFRAVLDHTGPPLTHADNAPLS